MRFGVPVLPGTPLRLASELPKAFQNYLKVPKPLRVAELLEVALDLPEVFEATQNPLGIQGSEAPRIPSSSKLASAA